MGDSITCDSCGETVERGDHWVHISVFHHNREDNPERMSRDDPKNDAYTFCPDCGGMVEDMTP